MQIKIYQKKIKMNIKKRFISSSIAVLTVFTAIIALWTLSSWDFNNDYRSEYKPILIERSELNNSVSFQDARQMCNTGKIYFKDDFIFLNEKYKGVHIIDNSNPGSPVNVGFIAIPGCIDIAIKNNTLYADNAVDLVAIKLTDNFNNVTVTKRIKNVFPEYTTPDRKLLRDEFLEENRPPNTIIIGWEKIGD